MNHMPAVRCVPAGRKIDVEDCRSTLLSCVRSNLQRNSATTGWSGSRERLRQSCRSPGARELSFLHRMTPKTLNGERVLMNSLCARIHPKMLFTTVIRRDHACLAKSSFVSFHLLRAHSVSRVLFWSCLICTRTC